jgi:hypothetical protein
LGKKSIDTLLAAEAKADLDPLAGDRTSTSFYGFKANSDRDVQAKVRDDPLFAVKQREQAMVCIVLC